jgi:DNA polymerase-3 subunit beta
LTIEPGNDNGPGRIHIAANAAEVGNDSGVVDGGVSGEGNKIALNVKYLQDAINAIKTAQVSIETKHRTKSCRLPPRGC